MILGDANEADKLRTIPICELYALNIRLIKSDPS